MKQFLIRNIHFKTGLQFLLYGVLLFFIYLMILITLQYIPVDFNAAFLAVKQNEIQYIHYQIAFFTHVYTSIFVLILGMFQFSDYVRKKYTAIHRNLGKAYIFLILFFAAPSGLVMGYYGNGGMYSQISFCLLAILWFCFTLMAFVKIRKKKYEKHRNYMILSYSLTLSAISLRLFKWIIVHTVELPPMDTYKIVVWLGWLTNLSIAMMIIKIKSRTRNTATNTDRNLVGVK